MKLIVACNQCGQVLVKAEKDDFTEMDIDNYKTSASCTTVKDDGSFDGQDSIVVSKMIS